MKVLKVALAVTLAVGLVLGLALPGLAASDDEVTQIEGKSGHRWLKGTVSSVNEADETFTIERGEQTTDIRVNEGTRYFIVKVPPRWLLALRRNVIGAAPTEGQEQSGTIEQTKQIKLRGMEQANILGKGKALGRQALMPVESQAVAPTLLAQGEDNGEPKRLQGYLNWLRRFGEEATFDDLAVDDRVIVWVVPNEGEPLAKLVLIFKPSPYKRVVGEVTDITDDIIEITPGDGDPVELIYLIYDEDTRFILCGSPSLQEDEEAVAIYVEDGDDNLAKRITQGCRRPEVTDSAGS